MTSVSRRSAVRADAARGLARHRRPDSGMQHLLLRATICVRSHNSNANEHGANHSFVTRHANWQRQRARRQRSTPSAPTKAYGTGGVPHSDGTQPVCVLCPCVRLRSTVPAHRALSVAHRVAKEVHCPLSVSVVRVRMLNLAYGAIVLHNTRAIQLIGAAQRPQESRAMPKVKNPHNVRHETSLKR